MLDLYWVFGEQLPLGTIKQGGRVSLQAVSHQSQPGSSSIPRPGPRHSHASFLSHFWGGTGCLDPPQTAVVLLNLAEVVASADPLAVPWG